MAKLLTADKYLTKSEKTFLWGEIRWKLGLYTSWKSTTPTAIQTREFNGISLDENVKLHKNHLQRKTKPQFTSPIIAEKHKSNTVSAKNVLFFFSYIVYS